MQAQWAQYPAAMFRKPRFPWLEVAVLAPCAVAAALGVKPTWTATPLVIDMVYDSWNLILTQLCVFGLPHCIDQLATLTRISQKTRISTQHTEEELLNSCHGRAQCAAIVNTAPSRSHIVP